MSDTRRPRSASSVAADSMSCSTVHVSTRSTHRTVRPRRRSWLGRLVAAWSPSCHATARTTRCRRTRSTTARICGHEGDRRLADHRAQRLRLAAAGDRARPLRDLRPVRGPHVGRVDTFYDGRSRRTCPRPTHTAPQCVRSRSTRRGARHHRPPSGTVVVIQGPRFSTRSESNGLPLRLGSHQHDPVPRGLPRRELEIFTSTSRLSLITTPGQRVLSLSPRRGRACLQREQQQGEGSNLLDDSGTSHRS